MSRERAELSKKNPYHIPRYRYYELKMQEAEGMVRRIAPSRERSLALTKLDEALFWANAAIAAEGVMDHEE